MVKLYQIILNVAFDDTFVGFESAFDNVSCFLLGLLRARGWNPTFSEQHGHRELSQNSLLDF